MENIIFVVHILTALGIIGLILLQQGKGSEMGASFGAGASQTLFGASGSGNFFSRLTAVFAAIFFITSFSLAVIAKQKTQVDDDIPLPAAEKVTLPPVENDVPTIIDPAGSDVPSSDTKGLPADVPSVPVE